MQLRITEVGEWVVGYSTSIPGAVVLVMTGLFGGQDLLAQSSFTSASTITYDLKTHRTDKPIPFDLPFTLVVPKIPNESVEAVDAYEAKLHDGQRGLKPGGHQNGADFFVRDASLAYKVNGDTLSIYFLALRPNKDFDIGISTLLGDFSRGIAMDVNALLAAAKYDDAQEKYNSVLLPSMKDKEFNRRVGYLPFEEFVCLFNDLLSSVYKDLSDASKYTKTKGLTLDQVQAIDIQIIKDLPNFKDAPVVAEVIIQGRWKEMELGLIAGNKIFSHDFEVIADLKLSARIANLKSNFLLMDSLLARVDRILTKGQTSVTVAAASLSVASIRTSILDSRTAIVQNLKFIEKNKKEIDRVIDEVADFRQAFYLVGSTVASDLKAKGGNILFVDLGLANIMAPTVMGGIAYIPKPYYGVSIYFRPIDKNTRQGSFTRKFKDRDETNGPDYGIFAKRTIGQQLALNVGFTTGSLSGDFDNFYNNTSLLVGPSLRFARAFKVSLGAAFLRQTSKNPLNSDKVVIAGGYVGLSVDVDVVQGLKDVTSLIWK